ncbi:MAG: 16S rRNA (cytidine(1402)-2'-O)-methyltransferase [Raoultibacter sp.]
MSQTTNHPESEAVSRPASQTGKLVICPTPIGNLGDMTARALDALRQADVVCAEDTRVTGRLLAAFGIEKRLERLDEASITHAAPALIARIAAGEIVAYCSDAGMPGVSDPGQRLVSAARSAKVGVEVLPGPTATATAYVASGFTCPRFYFGGFFPRKAAERVAVLENLHTLDAVLLFYESPKRIVSALEAIAVAFPQREVALCRELTKMHEEVVRALSGAVAQEFATRAQVTPVKGEIVIVIDAPSTAEQLSDADLATDAARVRAAELKAQGTCTKKDITQALQTEFGIARNAAYAIVLHG